ncbi:PIH1 domain-containing protein 1-like [Leptopilina heterotoma]|uniref:PIH1 domain-containing protein 1-like n=1 Tax=Leptopilina heterotoma TaxID=63436 RepID=UPI001CA9526A|nr:PIH1 domain-containing protein 1-like [Leptopilina heterotoma]
MPNKLLVDDSLLYNNLQIVNEKDEFSELLKTLDRPNVPFVLVKPMPGVCAKMRTETGEKGFINICHTENIPAPEDISDEKLVSVATSDNPTFVIPMSIGQERLESDKGGSLCPAYDIAINTQFFLKCQDNKIFMIFTTQVMVDAINKKFAKTYEYDNCVILKNRKVLGKLQQHRIEKREVRKPQYPKTLIEDVTSNSKYETKMKSTTKINNEKKSLTKNAAKEVNDKRRNSDYVILQTPANGKAKKLIALFRIPVLVFENITVEIGEDRIIVESKDSNYLVDVFTPYAVNKEEAYAELDPDLGILRLNLPVKC